MPIAAAKDKEFEADNDKPKVKEKKRTRGQNKKTTEMFAKTTMSEDGAVQNERLMEVVNTLFLPPDMDEAAKNAKIQDAFDALCAIEPKDDFERMLAAQMVACHHAAMESFRRASLPNQTFAGRDMALKHAQKLMSTYRLPRASSRASRRVLRKGLLSARL
jgi:predicted outer membrane protein